MNIAPLIVKAYSFKAAAFERATKNPVEIQRKLLLGLLSRNKNTVYGKEHGFSSIRSVEDYRKNVPLNNYETLRPYIERLMRGKSCMLTVDRPTLFGITSGTMGKPKYIPVSDYSRKKKKDVMNVWTYYTLKDHPKILDGKILAIVSPEAEGLTASNIPFGAESGHAYKNMPEIVKNLYVLPYEVFEITDYDAKYYCILRIAVEQNVSVIASLNPSTILLLCQRIEKTKFDIIDDIRRGTLNSSLNLRHDMRKRIESTLKPNPARADELTALMKSKDGALLPIDFWPNLAAVVCWKGGAVGVYIQHLKKYFGETISIRDFGYVSSEARVSIPMCDDGCCGVLAITGNFYEFVPLDKMGDKNKPFLLAHELKAGEEYYIVITTHEGLYRYDIDDVIKVTGFFNNTPVIEFVRKGSIVSSVTGEKIYESHIDDALNKAAQAIGVSLQFFSAFVEWGVLPRYAFMVEASNDLTNERKAELLRNIEKELTKINVEYETKRRSQRLDYPVLKIVPCGAFEEYRCKKVAAGCHDGQFKMPKLSTDINFPKNFKIIEEIKF